VTRTEMRDFLRCLTNPARRQGIAWPDKVDVAPL
jgi:hypothetical protein